MVLKNYLIFTYIVKFISHYLFWMLIFSIMTKNKNNYNYLLSSPQSIGSNKYTLQPTVLSGGKCNNIYIAVFLHCFGVLHFLENVNSV